MEIIRLICEEIYSELIKPILPTIAVVSIFVLISLLIFIITSREIPEEKKLGWIIASIVGLAILAVAAIFGIYYLVGILILGFIGVVFFNSIL